MHSFPLHTDWQKSDSSVDGYPQANWRWNSNSTDVVASSLSFSLPTARASQRACSETSLWWTLRVCSFKMIQIRIVRHLDHGTSILNWLILYQSFTRLYLLVPLMHYDLRYPRSLILIWIIPIECSLRQCQAQTCPERKKERLKVSKGKKTPTRGSVVDYFFKCNQVSPVKTHHSTADYK